jgi:hypothetical protein
MRKEDTSSLTAKDVGTLTTLETFARWTNWHPRGKMARHEADHSPSASAEVKKL